MFEPLPYEQIPQKELFYLYKNLKSNVDLEKQLYDSIIDYINTDLGGNHFKNWLWLQNHSGYANNIKMVLNYLSDNEWRQSYNSYYGDVASKKLLNDFFHHSIGWWLHYTNINNPTSFPYEYWQAKHSDFKLMYKNLEDKSTPYIMDCVRITTYENYY